MGLGSIEDGSNATMVLPNAHMGPSGAEALVIPATRSDQCPLTPLRLPESDTTLSQRCDDTAVASAVNPLCCF